LFDAYFVNAVRINSAEKQKAGNFQSNNRLDRQLWEWQSQIRRE